MLQQTQVVQVREYFAAFIARFPNLTVCAQADLEQVLAAWSGLGYYRRARHLHAATRKVVDEFGGKVPELPQDLIKLPGIGRSTANAISAAAYCHAVPVLDTNVKRVLGRALGITAEKDLWLAAADAISVEEPRRSNQAMMDLGALRCHARTPDCQACPLESECIAKATDSYDSLSRVRSPKPARKTVKLEHWLVKTPDGWLLQQRRGEGIWQDMYWGLDELPPNAEVQGSLAPVEWLLTHRKLEIHTRVATLDRDTTVHLGESADEYGPTQHPRRSCFASLQGAPVPAVLRTLAADAESLLEKNKHQGS